MHRISDAVDTVRTPHGPCGQRVKAGKGEFQSLVTDGADDLGSHAGLEYGLEVQAPGTGVLVHIYAEGFLLEKPVDLPVGPAKGDLFPEVDCILAMKAKRLDIVEEGAILQSGDSLPVDVGPKNRPLKEIERGEERIQRPNY